MITEEEERHIARIVKENQKEPFAAVPGGKAGAVAALGILVFFGKDYFGSFKRNSEELSKVSSQQMLILNELVQVNKAVDDLKEKTEKRYTYDDAAKDHGMVQRQLDSHGELLKTRGTWIIETTRRLDMLENEVLGKKREKE
ncbi:MAG: hypothetical protein ACPG32_04455 [Akkermansiaceae bacterium]